MKSPSVRVCEHSLTAPSQQHLPPYFGCWVSDCVNSTHRQKPVRAARSTRAGRGGGGGGWGVGARSAIGTRTDRWAHDKLENCEWPRRLVNHIHGTLQLSSSFVCFSCTKAISVGKKNTPAYASEVHRPAWAAVIEGILPSWVHQLFALFFPNFLSYDHNRLNPLLPWDESVV